MTPKRPDAICLTALRRQSPLPSRSKRCGSSPPSPELDRAPRRFIAIASVSWASALIEPNDIAPVTNRFTIVATGSTSSRGTAAPIGVTTASRSRSASGASSWAPASASAWYAANVARSSLPTAACSAAIDAGFQAWRSPRRRHW